MQRVQTPHMWHICAGAAGDPRNMRPSENLELPLADEVPDFVARTAALGLSGRAAWNLYRALLRTGRDIRARRITPAAGLRRIERLALAAPIGATP